MDGRSDKEICDKNQLVNISAKKTSRSLKYLFEVKAPNFLWVADKPLNQNGTLKKIYTEEIESKFNFKYEENILVENNLITQCKFGHQGGMEHVWEKIQDRLAKPLNDQLAVCFIDEQVGYGLFAREHIKAGTIISIYSGELEQQTERDDYGMSINDSPYRINAHQYGGITRFIQHMPFSIQVIIDAINRADQEDFFKILEGNALDIDADQRKSIANPIHLASCKQIIIDRLIKNSIPEQQEIIEHVYEIEHLATANIRTFMIEYHKKPILYFQTCCDIQQGEQLGISYGQEYWIKKGTFPLYFYRNGELVPKEIYIPSLGFLLEHYIKLKGSEVDLNDALRLAVYNGNIFDVKLLLLEYGAAIDNQDVHHYKRAPLHLAVIRSAMLKNKEDKECLIKVIKLLIAMNTFCDLKDVLNRTALHYAVWNDLKNITKLLLTHGVVVEGKDQDGYKPFDYNPLLAQKIFRGRIQEWRSKLFSSNNYQFYRVLKGESRCWIKGASEEAGLYFNMTTQDKVFLFLGRKNNAYAISIIHSKIKMSVKSIKAKMDWFDIVEHFYIVLSLACTRYFDILSNELKEAAIQYKTLDIKNDGILITTYTQKGKKMHPYIDYFTESNLNCFYGELVGYQCKPVAISKKNLPNKNEATSSYSFISDILPKNKKNQREKSKANKRASSLKTSNLPKKGQNSFFDNKNTRKETSEAIKVFRGNKKVELHISLVDNKQISIQSKNRDILKNFIQEIQSKIEGAISFVIGEINFNLESYHVCFTTNQHQSSNELLAIITERVINQSTPKLSI